ncbi:MAG TPA: PQQ-dependent sugar dehydrogenase [Actinomycetota bacterium]|nr:PQQ-dependent sugar dehydrogenase [Actinomycetota bacterium]
MRRKLTGALVLMVLGSIVPTAGALPRGARVETYQGGLAFPVDMAWVPGTKKIFFTEKGGAVRVMVRGRLLASPCVTLDVDSSGESGALGIALHPRFARNHKLYVFYTNNIPHENRVTSFVVRRNRCGSPNHVVTGLNASTGYHNGGQIEFAGGKLFVATGEDHNPAAAQLTTNRLGKILRYNANGTIPIDNPFGASNPVWSYGHRNPFGLAHKPGTNKLYSSENGQNCDDELNHIVKGRNYGWGANYQCGTAGVGVRPKPPIRRWTNIIVPTDVTWYRGRLKSLNGLLMGDYEYGRIHRFVMNDAKTKVRRDVIVHDALEGIVDVSKGPGGWLYFLTPTAIMRVVKP